MIEELKQINDKLIEQNKDNEIELKKQELIHEMLNFDDLFFRISIEEAYGILRDLGYEENKIKEIYLNLVDKENR